MTTVPLSAETIKNFLYASTATVSMQMLKRGLVKRMKAMFKKAILSYASGIGMRLAWIPR